MKTWLWLLGGLFVANASAAGMGEDAARLLLNRTGFAPVPVSQVKAFAVLRREQAVEKLLDQTTTLALTPPPVWVNDYTPPSAINKLNEEGRKAFYMERGNRQQELKQWWLREMVATPTPLTERMTLFWHSHFATSVQKVGEPQLMYRQNSLLRQYALGNYREMLHAVARDPAMLIWLDGVSNRKGAPNENFAREVMELFVLGEGRYTQQDVKEAARAFTGWSRNGQTGEFVFNAAQHDAGIKTVLGKSGNFDGDDVIDILLDQPAAAEHIVGQLWEEFISPVPDPVEVKHLSEIFRENQYAIKPLLRALFSLNAFYDKSNRATLVKSPIELIVGTLRQFDVHPSAWQPLVYEAEGMGESLFAPPNVKGWPTGEQWINGTTLLRRKAFLERIMNAQEPPYNINAQGMDAMHFNVSQWKAQLRQRPEKPISSPEAELLLPLPPQPLSGLALVRQLVLDPAYQLK